MTAWKMLRGLAATGLVVAMFVSGGAAGVMAQDDGDAPAAFAPDDCWSGDARIEPDRDTDNVMLYPQWTAPPQMVIDEDAEYIAVMSTNKGDMSFALNSDAAPNIVNNFICLAVNDYYDVTPFHRVLAGFMIQGGDPTGTGTGGPGYTFDDELPGDDLDYVRGTLAMANAGPDTQGSQFFIVHQDQSGKLAKDYTIFGQMTDGGDVLDDIADTPVVPGPGGEPSLPAQFLVVTDVTIQVASGS